jgi:hypothetical protein
MPGKPWDHWEPTQSNDRRRNVSADGITCRVRGRDQRSPQLAVPAHLLRLPLAQAQTSRR